MKMNTKPFKGSNVYLSRNLVQPELFDSIHDALKLNGATVFLCCDPSQIGTNDYHVISSPQHEKFENLKDKGCKLLGPECVLSCAKENRSLPIQEGFTCCLAMDGVKVLASGFEKDEKGKIEELVTAMGGVFQNKPSTEVNFVVTKNVLAAKYRWALTASKKPIVTISWIYQCWKEHRVVPHELYRVLPFSGLTICITRVRAEMRKEMEKLILNNGGIYSGDLTKKCTHLISDTPEGVKYKVAKTWGRIHIVTPRWLDQSISRKACLDAGSYPVQVSSTSSTGVVKGGMSGGQMGQHSQAKGNTYSESVQSYGAYIAQQATAGAGGPGAQDSFDEEQFTDSDEEGWIHLTAAGALRHQTRASQNPLRSMMEGLVANVGELCTSVESFQARTSAEIAQLRLDFQTEMAATEGRQIEREQSLLQSINDMFGRASGSRTRD